MIYTHNACIRNVSDRLTSVNNGIVLQSFQGNNQDNELIANVQAVRNIKDFKNEMDALKNNSLAKESSFDDFLTSAMKLKKSLVLRLNLKMGRLVGLEPTHIGTTIRGLNHLTTPAIYLIIS